MAAEKKIIGWFTANGKHIPIFEESEPSDVEKKKDQDIANAKAQADALNGKNKKQVLSGKDATQKLETLEKGIPLKIKSGKDLDYKQVLYMGKGEVQGRSTHQFFDGSGVAGIFGFSPKFISENKDIRFLFDDNDPSAVTNLINMVNKAKKNK